MSLKANNVQSPFTDLMEHQNGETILDMFNTIHDAIFKFKNINDDDTKELSELVSKYSGDHLFNSFLTKFFVNGMNAYTLKSTIQNLSEFPSCTLSSALHVLSDIYDKTENEMIKGYLLFLTFDIEHFINFALDDWKKVQMANTLFNHYIFDEALPKYLKRYLSIALVNHGYCLLSFFCQYDSAEPSVIPALTKYANISIKWELCTSVKSIFSQIINNYELLNEKVVSAGFDIEGSFENAVKLFSYVANNWDNLSATFTLRNKPLPTGTSDYTLSGGARVSDSDLVKIFAGQYSLVPYSSPYAKSPTLDVIADFDAYNELPNKRKLQVAGFLINNRKRFNDVMGEAAQIVINGLHSKLNASNVSSAFDGGQFYSLSARNVGFGQNDDSIISDAKNFMSKLSKKFNDAPMATFDNAISFIVHQYLPMLNQFQNKCKEAYGVADSRLLFDKCSTNTTLNALGVASFVPSIIGGKKHRVQPRYNEQTEQQRTEQQRTEQQTDSQQTDSQQEIYGASAAEDLVKSFINGQRNFNKEYENIYRKLISALNAVSISNVHSHTITKLYSVCNQFDSIAIKRAKTTSFISGYYGAKNYNKLYTKCVENTIHAIEASGVPGFNDVLVILNQLKDLLVKTAQEVKELRIKYITAPKSVSETLIVESKRIKNPCSLTQKDFNAFSEAINRIYNTIRNYSSETSIYNTRQQLDSYLEKVDDRARVIREHYDLKLQGIAIKYQQYATTRERQYALDAEKTIVGQIRDIMLYLNKTLDVKLAKERISHLHTVNLTKEQVENIEKAFLAFKNVKITVEFKHEMEKLNEVLNPLQVSSVFKIVKKLRKLIEKSQYVQFLAQLYKELHIFNEDFDWNEFIEKYTTLVVLSCVKIERLYSIDNDFYTPERLIHKLGILFEEGTKTFIVEKIGTNVVAKHICNAGYNFVVDTLKRSIQTENTKGSMNFSTVRKCFGSVKSPIENIKFDYSYNGTEIVKNEADLSSLGLTTEVVDNDENELLKHSVVQKLIDAYKDYELKPYYYTRLPAFISLLDDLLKAGPPRDAFNNFLNKDIKNLERWSVSISQSDSELWIADFTIESLFANVIAIVDKYWSIKYNGVLPIPLNINSVLRGGDLDEEEQVEGGSVFDSMPLHDQTFSNVIIEAVPFYICALHIISYYISTFGVNTIKRPEKNATDLQLVLSINKVSSLYPIYEIFHKYQATIETLTPQQLKICLSVLNDYWSQTQGNEAARLSRAIDLVFNELNSCFIFTDKLQYELMKSTNSLSKTSIDIIDSKLQFLVNKMKEQLDNSIVETHEDPALQNRRLEGLLNFAFNEVKRSPETQRLSILKSLLSRNDDNGELRDYYTFMETVITPLLICAKSYMYIFSLFDNYSFDDASMPAGPLSRGEKMTIDGLDLTQFMISYRNINNINGQPQAESVWKLINDIRHKRENWKKVLFMENPIVYQYNHIKLEESFNQFHSTGRFSYPNFWLVMDESTYPTQPTITLSYSRDYHRVETTHLLRQIYPTVNAETVGDYYNHCITEFIADYDHFIHAFMSYPGLSDKTIKTIANKAHDAFKISNVPAKNKPYNYKSTDSFGSQHVYTITSPDGVDVSQKLLANAENLIHIPISKVDYYIPPMAPALGTIIPVFTEGANSVEELEIVGTNTSAYHLLPLSALKTVATAAKSQQEPPIRTMTTVEPFNNTNVAIDNTGMYVKSASCVQDSITSCEYTWLDWALYMIARCNKINYCVPYRLLQLLQDSSALAQYLRTPGFFKVSSQNFQKYNRFSSGAYGNIITQNIVARSVSNWNKDRTDLASLGAAWTASIISVLPFIISKLSAVKLSTNQSVVYGGMSVYQHLTQLIEVLTMFYDELGNYTPFIPFMASSITINASRVRPHLFAELLSIIDNQELGDLESSDFIKLEWANQHFFTGIDGLTFPEYKNRDRFEWIKQFGSDKLTNGTFKTEFDSSVQSLGRIVWSGLIAKSRNYIINYNNQFHEIDELIREVMMITCEVDTKIVETFIQNIISEYAKENQMPSGLMTGGDFMRFKEGALVRPTDDQIEKIKNLLKGVADISKESFHEGIEIGYDGYNDSWRSEMFKSRFATTEDATDYNLLNNPVNKHMIDIKAAMERLNNRINEYDQGTYPITKANIEAVIKKGEAAITEPATLTQYGNNIGNLDTLTDGELKKIVDDLTNMSGKYCLEINEKITLAKGRYDEELNNRLERSRKPEDKEAKPQNTGINEERTPLFELLKEINDKITNEPDLLDKLKVETCEGNKQLNKLQRIQERINNGEVVNRTIDAIEDLIKRIEALLNDEKIVDTGILGSKSPIKEFDKSIHENTYKKFGIDEYSSGTLKNAIKHKALGSENQNAKALIDRIDNKKQINPTVDMITGLNEHKTVKDFINFVSCCKEGVKIQCTYLKGFYDTFLTEFFQRIGLSIIDIKHYPKAWFAFVKLNKNEKLYNNFVKDYKNCDLSTLKDVVNKSGIPVDKADVDNDPIFNKTYEDLEEKKVEGGYWTNIKNTYENYLTENSYQIDENDIKKLENKKNTGVLDENDKAFLKAAKDELLVELAVVKGENNNNSQWLENLKQNIDNKLKDQQQQQQHQDNVKQSPNEQRVALALDALAQDKFIQDKLSKNGSLRDKLLKEKRLQDELVLAQDNDAKASAIMRAITRINGVLDGLKKFKKVGFVGGLFELDKFSELVKGTAKTLAMTPTLHCSYIDYTQNFTSLPPIFNENQLLYKYLYNPSIFPYNDSNKASAVVRYLSSKGCFMVNAPLLKKAGQTFVYPIPTPTTGIQTSQKYLNKAFEPFKSALDNTIAGDETVKISDTSNPIPELYNVGTCSTPSTPNIDTDDEVNPLKGTTDAIYPLDDKYIRMKPRQHIISIDDRMFMLCPLKGFYEQYLFSPQKDIHNVLVKQSHKNANQFCALVPTNFYTNYEPDAKTGIPTSNFDDFKATLTDSNTYALDKCIGEITTLKSHHKFDPANFSYNPIYTFIQSLLEANLDSVFSSNSALEINNFGFDYGSTKIMSGGILPSIDGGFNINDGFIRDLVNTHASFDDIQELNLLTNAYGKDKSNPGQQLYSFIFKSGFGPIKDNHPLMFHLIMNYFHKYNISFNSMFNQLCFPSIIFNAAGLRLSICRLKEVASIIAGIVDKNKDSITEDRYKSQLLIFATKYLTMYVDDKTSQLALDLVKDYKYQVALNGDFNRSTTINDTMKSIIDRINNLSSEHQYLTLAISNQFLMPSISNNFMVEVINYINPNSDKANNENFKNLPSLFSTGIMSSLRHLDSITTYISVLFMLLKETSYYSHEYDRDMTYFNVQSPEAFSVI